MNPYDLIRTFGIGPFTIGAGIALVLTLAALAIELIKVHKHGEY